MNTVLENRAFMNHPLLLQQRTAAPKKGKPSHERADLVEKLRTGINATRTGKFKPCTFGQINGKTAKLSVPELYALLKECTAARAFGAMFWFKLRLKKA